MNYEELLEKYENAIDMTEEEVDMLYNFIDEKVCNEKYLNQSEFLIFTNEPYESFIIETGSHGWILKQLVFEIKNEHYMTKAWYHDDYGFSDDNSYDFVKCEPREITTTKWFPIE